MTTEFGEYSLCQDLDYGGIGQTKLVKKDNTMYILKTLKNLEYNEKSAKSFHQEIEILKKLSQIHDNIYTPHLYDSYEVTNFKEVMKMKMPDKIKHKPYYIIDFYSRLSLSFYIGFLKSKTKQTISEEYAKVIFKKILEGIKFCHNNNICHLDIKLNNIVFDKEYNPIIIDFGLSEIKDDSNKGFFQGEKGAKMYMCPEMFKKNEYNGIKADIFSLGVVLFNIVTGGFGFDAAIESDKKYKLIIKGKDIKNYEEYWNEIKNNLKDKNEKEKKYSDEFKDLYVKMVAFNPDDRPETIEEILKHEWFNKLNNDTDDTYKKGLNEIIKEEFGRIYDQMGKETSDQIEIARHVINNNYNTRSFEKNDCGDYFKPDLKLNYISEDRINVNLSCTIKGYLKESKFMSLLIVKINEKYEDCQIEPSKEEFSILFNIGDDDDDFSMKIRLLKYKKENDKYLVEFVRDSGSISDYFKYFFEIKEIIKNLYI